MSLEWQGSTYINMLAVELLLKILGVGMFPPKPTLRGLQVKPTGMWVALPGSSKLEPQTWQKLCDSLCLCSSWNALGIVDSSGKGNLRTAPL